MTDTQSSAATTGPLLPCPFCGPGQSMVDPWYDDVAKRWAIGCGRCGASSGRSVHAEGSKEAAIKAWNTRGLGDAAQAVREPNREVIHQAAKNGNLQYRRDSEAQRVAFNEWRAGGYVGDCPQIAKGSIVDYITDAVVAAIAAPVQSCSAGTAKPTKTVYVKRWRTLVELPEKYADEIVQALRDEPQGARGPSEPLQCLRCGTVDAFGPVSPEKK